MNHTPANAAVLTAACLQSSLQPLVVSCAQLTPQDLAHGRARNALDEHIFLGPLEVGQPRRAQMRLELLHASALRGRRESRFSTSSGYTFSPPVITMSSTRPMTYNSPSSSCRPRSPVKYQPER